MRNKECKISPPETCALHAQEAVSTDSSESDAQKTVSADFSQTSAQKTVSADSSESDACASASADSSYCSTHGSEASSESSAESSAEDSMQSSDAAEGCLRAKPLNESKASIQNAKCNEGEGEGEKIQNAECKMQNEFESEDEGEEGEDYARRAEEDMAALCALFPELSPDGEAISLGSLRNPTRFAELREAGLTVEEAFLASNYRMLAERPIDLFAQKEMKAHLRPALPRASGRAAAMPSSLLVRSRALFEGLSDSELASLYRRVTK